MIVKNTIKFILSVYLLAQGGNAADLQSTNTALSITPLQAEHQKNDPGKKLENEVKKSSNLPAKETITGLSLTAMGIYSILTNKDIPHKYKLGTLGIILGAGAIYLSPQTSSLTKHLYTAMGSGIFGLSSGLFLGGICGTVFGGACVILYCFHDVNKPVPFLSALKSSLSFFSSSEIRHYIAKATNTPYSVFTNPGAKAPEPAKQITDAQ